MKTIISASRRTDLPRFHLAGTLEAFKQGYVELANPYNQELYRIDLKPESVACIAWWSKDYSEYLKNKEALHFFKQYNQLFHFTINGYTNPETRKLLEPGVTTSLEDRIKQAEMLAKMFSPGQVLWRFDPIVFWKTPDGKHLDNLGDLFTLSREMGKIGIDRCYMAFADLYAKFKRRATNRLGDSVKFYEEPLAERRMISKTVAEINRWHGIKTYSCAHADIVDANRDVLPSHCMDADLIEHLFGEAVSHAKDQGQRSECGCVLSKDIGSYEQECHHKCIYCYANPKDK